MLKTIKGIFAFGLLMAAFAANASHIMITNPSVNGIDLDSVSGFTNPTINATVGSTLDLTAGFYDHCGGTCIENWNIHFSQTSGSLTLIDFNQNVTPSGDSTAPFYITFSQLLTSAGTWVGFFEPIQDASCPSYRYANGFEGGGGCGGPSESLGFTLAVTDAGKVPEPASVALIGLGLLGFIASRRKRAKK